MKKKHQQTTNGKTPNYSWSKDFNICYSPKEAFQTNKITLKTAK